MQVQQTPSTIFCKRAFFKAVTLISELNVEYEMSIGVCSLINDQMIEYYVDDFAGFKIMHDISAQNTHAHDVINRTQ